MGRVAGAVRVDLRLLEQEEDERQAKLKALRRAAKEGFDEIDQRPEETWRSMKRSKCPVKLMLRDGMIVSFCWNSTAIGNYCQRVSLLLGNELSRYRGCKEHEEQQSPIAIRGSSAVRRISFSAQVRSRRALKF